MKAPWSSQGKVTAERFDKDFTAVFGTQDSLISTAGRNLSLKKITSALTNGMCFQEVSREQQRSSTALHKTL